jgi:HD-like signal output (HDOD) protein
MSLQEKRPLHVVEEELTGTSHAQIGGYLLGLWGLPPMVVSAVSAHHRPIRATQDKIMDLSLAVHIADLLEHEAKGQTDFLDSQDMDGLSDWNEFLPEWRETAKEIVQREAQSQLLSG